MKREQNPQLDIQTCTCVMHSNEETSFDWYDFLKHDLKPDKVNINYIRPPSADPNELNFDHTRDAQLSQMILDPAVMGSAAESVRPDGTATPGGAP